MMVYYKNAQANREGVDTLETTTTGVPFPEYLEAKNIGGMACLYKDAWFPPMFGEGDKGYTA
jgi:hypothetical protein